MLPTQRPNSKIKFHLSTPTPIMLLLILTIPNPNLIMASDPDMDDLSTKNIDYSSLDPSSYDAIWRRYVERHNKVFDCVHDERKSRLNLIKKIMELKRTPVVRSMKRSGLSNVQYTLTLNVLADMDPKTFKSMLGYRRPDFIYDHPVWKFKKRYTNIHPRSTSSKTFTTTTSATMLTTSATMLTTSATMLTTSAIMLTTSATMLTTSITTLSTFATMLTTNTSFKISKTPLTNTTTTIITTKTNSTNTTIKFYPSITSKRPKLKSSTHPPGNNNNHNNDINTIYHYHYCKRINNYYYIYENGDNTNKRTQRKKRSIKITYYKLTVNITDLPVRIDWRESGCVSPVRTQGKCGSCWAFAANGVLESQYFLNVDNTTTAIFSAQNLIDCSQGQGNDGCKSGAMELAYYYVMYNSGINTEIMYPYIATQNPVCLYQPSKNTNFSLIGWSLVEANDELAMLQALAFVGPIAAAIDATPVEFQLYKSGILCYLNCSKKSVNHGIVIVGYTTIGDIKVWIIKNSWSTKWGMDGYGYVCRNTNFCGIAYTASFPTLMKNIKDVNIDNNINIKTKI